MRITECRKKLIYWQDRLGLGPWRIAVQWRHADTEHGSVEYDPLHRTATIFLNKPNKLPAPVTVESVIVHELVHLVLVELDLVEKANKQQKLIALERVVNQITVALLGTNTHG